MGALQTRLTLPTKPLRHRWPSTVPKPWHYMKSSKWSSRAAEPGDEVANIIGQRVFCAFVFFCLTKRGDSDKLLETMLRHLGPLDISICRLILRSICKPVGGTLRIGAVTMSAWLSGRFGSLLSLLRSVEDTYASASSHGGTCGIFGVLAMSDHSGPLRAVNTK